MRKLLIISLLALSVSLFGQHYKYKAPVNKVERNEFVRITLSPEITSKLRNDFTDIRIYDTANVEVPYIFYQEKRVNEKELFVDYAILTTVHDKKRGYTRIIIRNPSKSKINNIVLRIKNADVRKRLKLNGSYDQENWYVLKDNYYYNSIESNFNTSEIRVMNFPWSDYEYYELLIGNYFDRPINILQAGYYNLVKENGKYTPIETADYTTYDTLRQTLIGIPIGENFIDKIVFSIDTPKYYHRDVQVFVHETIKHKRKKRIQEKRLANFQLISNSGNSFMLNNIHADTLFIRIQNQDNPSLQIHQIKLFQLNKYLVADLNKNNSYRILFGDSKAEAPKYDLEYFSDSIQEYLNEVGTGDIVKLPSPNKDKSDGNFNLNEYWLWIIIIGVALLLAYMSYGMIKDRKE